MLAVHIEEGRVEVRRRPRPRRKPGHALIRLLCGGICNTDLELLRGYYSFRGTPGHEFVGQVIEADQRAPAAMPAEAHRRRRALDPTSGRFKLPDWFAGH